MSANRHEVGHFEIPADNVDGLRSFYSSLFEWEFDNRETQGYNMVKNAGISGALIQNRCISFYTAVH
jgi:predicted enzyme related to lactoylglutathione lyase